MNPKSKKGHVLAEDMKPKDIRALFPPDMRTVVVPIEGLEWRESGSGDGSRILTGYAAVYNQETILYEGSFWTFKEVIQAGAFDAVLSKSPDVHLNIGHDMSRAIARTGVSGIGGLELTSDSHGLKVYARVNPDDPDVQSLAAKMDLGIMDQMSFAFQLKAGGYSTTTTSDEETGRETDTRAITEVANLYDVCVCAQGAYPQTEASLRTIIQAINEQVKGRRSEEVDQEPEARSQEVSPDTSDAEVSDPLVERKLLVLKGRAAQARHSHPYKEEA